jgi:hypothetical protein
LPPFVLAQMKIFLWHALQYKKSRKHGPAIDMGPCFFVFLRSSAGVYLFRRRSERISASTAGLFSKQSWPSLQESKRCTTPMRARSYRLFFITSEASNKAKPIGPTGSKRCNQLAAHTWPAAIFYYEAQRVTKQGLPSLQGSKRCTTPMRARSYRLFFYYEAQRVTKQGLPSLQESKRCTTPMRARSYRLFFYRIRSL